LEDIGFILEQVVQDHILTHLATIVALFGVIISALWYWITFRKLKKSEQYKLVHDIQVMYSNAQVNHSKIMESTMLGIAGHTKEESRILSEVAFGEIMNTLEWASFLIMRNKLDKELVEYLRPTITGNYRECMESYPSLLNEKGDGDDGQEYKEMKVLYGKWMKDKHEEEVRIKIHEQI
jgi:hypothetical protein